MKNPDTGNKAMASTLFTTAEGSNCPSGGTDPACSVNVPVQIPALSITQTSTATSAVPGQQVGFTVTITDTGPTAYTGISVTDTLKMLDDADYNGDAAATAGTVSFASPVLTWTGNLAPGDTATVTFTVTVHDPDTGDKTLAATAASTAPGSSCAPGSGNAGCNIARPGPDPGADHHRGRRPGHRHPRPDGLLHHHRHRLRPDPLHRRHRHQPAVRHHR